MQIEELTLHTHHLADQKAFYHTLLGLPLLWEAVDSFTLQAGTTRLCFQETELDVLYHLAFSIPGTTFQEVKQWEHTRVTLLTITRFPTYFLPTMGVDQRGWGLNLLYHCESVLI